MKIDKMKHHSRDDCGFVKKINEIIDKLNEVSSVTDDQELTDSHLIERLTELEEKTNSTISLDELGSIKERLSDLEQCPINDVRLCQPMQTLERKNSDWPPLKSCKPDYDPDGVKFNKCMCQNNREKYSNFAMPGTFEWALIQMKNGKAVFRFKKQYGRYFLRPSTVLNCLAFQVEGCDTEQWEPVSEQILATDWQVIE